MEEIHEDTPPAVEETEVVPSTLTIPQKRKYMRSKPTLKQIRALQYINQGMSKRQAMLKAGYSEGAARHPKVALMEKKGVRRMISDMSGQLQDAGLTTQYMVQKFAEWMEATKLHTSMTEPDREVPDYQVQLKAYTEWKKVLDAENNGENGKIKRKLTIEEYVMDGEKEQQQS